jgi:hypothetical protein
VASLTATHTPSHPLDRRVQFLLVGLTAFDLILVVWVFALPDLWFTVFHGVDRVDPQHLLQRMGANWAAFFLVELIATVRWRRHAHWLLIVAGVRLSDIFTDVTYVIVCGDATWFAWAALPPMSVLNLLMGLWLIKAWKHYRLQSEEAA